MIFLLLLFLPSQLAVHFWPSWSLINGIRVDYLSPTLYLTDVLIIFLMILKGPRVKVQGSIILFVVLNAFFSVSPLVSLYKWVRVYEYYWLFKYLVSQKNQLLNLAPWTLSLSVLWTAILAWWQFFLQRSIGGFWYWLGERPLSISTPLIAKVSLAGQLLMRPYATFPHPNALAGFLLVAGLIILSITPRPPLNLRGGVQRTGVIYWLAVFAAFLTIPPTFSRTAIVLETLILLVYLRPLILKIFLLISSLYYLVSITGSAVSIPDRLSLIQNSLLIIQKSPILGVGLGTFIPSTINYELITNSYIYQPVHNIYLLLASELGLPAVLIIGYFVIKNLFQISSRSANSPNSVFKFQIALAVVLATGALDHYWLTLHQNTLLLVVLLALIKVQSMTTNDNV